MSMDLKYSHTTVLFDIKDKSLDTLELAKNKAALISN